MVVPWVNHRGHVIVVTYEEFTRRVMDNFERRDLEENFRKLTNIKQIGRIETYISSFLRLLMMVFDQPEANRVFMFIEGITEQPKGFVRSNKPLPRST